jgi:hypothetical protein
MLPVFANTMLLYNLDKSRFHAHPASGRVSASPALNLMLTAYLCIVISPIPRLPLALAMTLKRSAMLPS